MGLVLFHEFYFAIQFRSLSPCAVSYSACVFSYDVVSHGLQHVCKHPAKSVKLKNTVVYELIYNNCQKTQF